MHWRVCLTCSQWEARGVPRFAFRMGMAFCLVKRTQAVTLPHWRDCGAWSAATEADVARRVVWLQRIGVDVEGRILKGAAVDHA